MDQSASVTEQKKNNMLPVIAVIAILAIGFIAYMQMNKKPETAMTPGITNEQNAANTETNPTDSVADDTMESEYKNGTYTAIGDYTSPGGAEQISVKVTLEDGVIVESEVEPKAERPNSVKFQNIFADNYKSFVDGKNIDEVILDKVSGSSLSPKGFNDALNKIKEQAKS